MKIICAAHPFIPGRIGLSHIASTYLPADIFNRLMKRFGESALFICGLDIYGKYAFREMQATGLSHDQLKEDITNHITGIFDRLDIQTDQFYFSNDERLLRLYAMILPKLSSKQIIFKSAVQEFYCENCGRVLSKSEIIVSSGNNDSRILLKKAGPVLPDSSLLQCIFCTATIKSRETETWKISLQRQPVHAQLMHGHQEKWLQKQLSTIHENDFVEWAFSRKNYFGNTLPIDTQQQAYIWFDSLISKLVPFVTEQEFDRSAFSKAEFFCFFGKNILKYYYLVLPVIFQEGLDAMPASIQYCVRGFCRNIGDQSLKDFESLQKQYPPDYTRFYQAYTTPDNNSDFNLLPEDFRKVINSIMINAFLKYFSRLKGFFLEQGTPLRSVKKSVPADHAAILRLVNAGRVRKVLITLEELVRRRLATMKNVIDVNSTELLESLINEYRFVLDVLSCYMPTITQELNIFEDDTKDLIVDPSKLAFQVNWIMIK